MRASQPDPAKELEITRHGARIHVAGDLRTPADRERLRDMAKLVIEEIKAQRPELIVDVSRAQYLDVGAITALIMIARYCQRGGMRLAISGANDDVRELLHRANLGVLLAAHDARLT